MAVIARGEPESGMMNGAQALAWGAAVAQAGLVTGYPGAPATAVFDALLAYDEPGRQAYWAPNEKVAVEVAIGASLAGMRSLVVLKSVGLNIALDPLATVALCGCHAGLVILLGDDPGGWSSQNEQDSRWLALTAELPVVEPIDIESAASFMVQAFAWSESIGLPVIVRITSSFAAREGIALPPWELPPAHKRFAHKADRWVVLPASVVARRRTLHRKLRQMQHSLEASPYDRALLDSSLGVIAVGATWAKLHDLLGESEHTFSLLGLTSVYPLPEEALKQWLRRCSRVLVLEEGGPFVEQQLRALIGRAHLPTQIMGRDDRTVPEEGELTGADLLKGLGRLRPGFEGLALPEPPREMPSAAGLCPGCEYEQAFAALNEAMDACGGRKRFLLVGETGCMVRAHGALKLDVKLSLGAALGLAIGLAEAHRGQRIVVLAGDSCLFHTEINALPLAVDRGLNLTVVVLDNGVTGLTGGQPHPGSGQRSQRLAELVRACGVEPVQVPAAATPEAAQQLARALQQPGVNVVIVGAPCARHSQG
jgi:indolepyruvate ferredoxin oxidoreductase alpha subunit